MKGDVMSRKLTPEELRPLLRLETEPATRRYWRALQMVLSALLFGAVIYIFSIFWLRGE